MRLPRFAFSILAATLAMPLVALSSPAGAQAVAPGGAGDLVPAAASLDGAAGRFLRAASVDLTCYPARMSGEEGRWTFFLRGKAVLQVSEARLVAGERTIPAVRIDAPTPYAVLVDFEYEPLPAGTTAELVLAGEEGELARFAVPVVPQGEAPPEFRQPHLIRVQLKPWTLDYPLQTPNARGQVEPRHIDELGGDEQFLRLLRELGISRVRKGLPRFAEGDSIHWDERLQRDQIFSSHYLRQYLFFLDERRSEDAFKEIFLAFPQVEAAFINTDRAKLREETGSGFTPAEKSAPVPEQNRGGPLRQENGPSQQ